MTISVPAATNFRYEGNGSTDTFSYPARVFSESDLVVQIITRATDAIEETLTITTDYTVTLLSNGNASVTTVAGKIPSTTQDIFIDRNVASTQTVDLPSGSVFPAASVEAALDKAIVKIQDLESDLASAAKVPAQLQLEVELPIPVANNLLGWNNSANGLENKVALSLGLVTVSVPMSTFLEQSTYLEAKTLLGALSSKATTLRNLIINGDMSVAQRGTSFASITNTLTRTLDGWYAIAGAASAMAVSRQSSIGLAGFSNSLRFGRPSSNTNTSTHKIGQVIETANARKYAGKVLALSFWARAGADFSGSPFDSLNISMRTGTGSDEGASAFNAQTWTGNSSVLATSENNISTSWTRYTYTTATLGASVTEIGIELNFTPFGTAGANDWVEITGLQIEEQEVTDFDFLPPEINLARCHRRLQVSATTGGLYPEGNAYANSTTSMRGFIPTPVQMRTAPTISGIASYRGGAGSVAVTAISAIAVHPRGITFLDTTSGATQNESYTVVVDAATAPLILCILQ